MKKSLNLTVKREKFLHLDLNKVQPGKYPHHLTDSQSWRSPRITTQPDSSNLSNQSLFHKKGGTSMANSALPGLRFSEGFSGNDSSRIKSFTIDKFQTLTQGPQTTRVNYTEKRNMREKKIVLWENIAMTRGHFEKYPISIRHNEVANKADTNTVFKFLNLLQEVDDDFVGVIDPIIAVLKSLIYINFKTIESFLDEEAFETDEDLRKLFMTFQQPNYTYHKVCAGLMKMIMHKNEEIEAIQEKFGMKIKQMEKKCALKDEIIEELNQKLESAVSNEAYKNSIQQLDGMKEYYQSIAIENEELKAKHTLLEESHALLKTQYTQELEQNKKYKEKIQTLKNEKTVLLSQSENSKDAVNQMQFKVKGLKDAMDKVVVRLAIMKKDVIDLRQQNIVLENENSKLHIRAARGFEALTPRPDYKKIQEEKNIELDLYDESGKNQLASTSDVVNKLVDEIADLQKKLKEKTINFNVVKSERQGSVRKQSSDLTKMIPKRGSSVNSLFKTSLNRNQSDNRPSIQQESNGPRRDSFYISENKSTDEQQSEKSSVNEQNEEHIDPELGVNKPAKSKFSNSRVKVAIAQDLIKSDFGVKTIEQTQAIMKDVVEIKNTLKNLF